MASINNIDLKDCQVLKILKLKDFLFKRGGGRVGRRVMSDDCC
jgi:hypothetical protein